MSKSVLQSLSALAHHGDPCIYCGTPHDELEVGPCPALIDYARRIKEAEEKARSEKRNELVRGKSWPVEGE